MVFLFLPLILETPHLNDTIKVMFSPETFSNHFEISFKLLSIQSWQSSLVTILMKFWNVLYGIQQVFEHFREKRNSGAFFTCSFSATSPLYVGLIESRLDPVWDERKRKKLQQRRLRNIVESFETRDSISDVQGKQSISKDNWPT